MSSDRFMAMSTGRTKGWLPEPGLPAADRALCAGRPSAAVALASGKLARLAHVRQLELANHGDALLGHAIGGLPRGNAVTIGNFEDLGHVVENRARHAPGPFAVVAFQLNGHVHQPAGVDGIVGRVENAASFQLIAAFVGGQLVVGRAAHNLELEAGNGVFVDDGAQGRGREYIGLDVVDVFNTDGFTAQLDGRIDGVFVDVGDKHLGIFGAQQLDELHADMPGALHRVGILADAFIAELFLQAGANALQNPIGGEGGRVARSAVHLVNTHHVAGFLEDIFHVVDVDADILGGDVAAVERFNELAHGAEQRFGLVLTGVADDDGLAAAQVEAGYGRLVGHALGQAQNVFQRFLLAGIGPHAHAAQGGPQRGVVNGNDGLEPGVLVVAEDDLLVLAGVHGFKKIH